jgi:hypothetical protein
VRYLAIAGGAMLLLLSYQLTSRAANAYDEYEATCNADLKDNEQSAVVCQCIVRNLKAKGISSDEVEQLIGTLHQEWTGGEDDDLDALVSFELELSELCLKDPETSVAPD